MKPRYDRGRLYFTIDGLKAYYIGHALSMNRHYYGGRHRIRHV